MKGLFSFCNIGVLSSLCVYLRKYEILSTNLSKLYNQIYIDISIISIFRLRICDTECNILSITYIIVCIYVDVLACRGRDRLVVGFMTTYGISAYHH